jgi:hypothetical protein
MKNECDDGAQMKQDRVLLGASSAATSNCLFMQAAYFAQFCVLRKHQFAYALTVEASFFRSRTTLEIASMLWFLA